MTGRGLLEAREKKGWEQEEAARRLGVSQPYLSLLESGKRRVTETLARRAVTVFKLPAIALSLPANLEKIGKVSNDVVASNLATLGYPKLTHLKKARYQNPAKVLLSALMLEDLDTRLAEALPWIVLSFPDLDWQPVIRAAKINDLQNRLGFVISLARELAEKAGDGERATLLLRRERELERSLLAREDTLCHVSLTDAEKRWLRENRSEQARKWQLLTDLSPEHLSYAA